MFSLKDIDTNYEVDFVVKSWVKKKTNCECKYGKKTFGHMWTTRFDIFTEKNEEQRYPLLAGAPVSDKMCHYRGELTNITANSEKGNIKIRFSTGLKFSCRANFYYCLRQNIWFYLFAHKFPLSCAMKSFRPQRVKARVYQTLFLWINNVFLAEKSLHTVVLN